MDKAKEANKITRNEVHSRHPKENLPWIDEKFKLLAESSYYWEMFRDKDGTVKYVSPAFERITGYRAEDYLSGKISFENLVHPDDLRKVKDFSGKILLRETFNDVEIKMVRKDGKAVYVSLLSYPVVTESEGFIGFRTSIRDITERKKLEEDMKKINADLELRVIELTAKVAESGKVLADYKRKAEEDLRRAQERLERHIQEQITNLTNSNELLQAEISRYKEGEKELQRANSDLEKQLKECTAEITSLKRLLAKHKESEESLQKAHKALELRIKELTTELAKSNELLAESKKKERVASKDNAHLESQLKELSAKAAKVERIYLKLRKAKKEARQEREENRKLSVELQKAYGKLKEVHNELLRRDRKRIKPGSLVAGIVQEAKDPLYAIFHDLEILHGKFKMGDPKREITADIMKKIKKFEGKIDELSNYGRKINLNLRRYNLIRCLNTNLAIMRPICRVRRVKVNKQYSPLPTMEIDDEKINQALHYVMENAIQAMPKGGVLSAYAGLDEPAKAAVIKIHNTGPLVGKQRLKENRLDLGLAIARRIISKHGGRIKIENKVSGRNKGVVFIIRLPLKHQTLTKER